ncbi:MAG TPA: protein kinase [Terriglobia bacterium]|nr:protein kinase [Terriglobia bacterium]
MGTAPYMSPEQVRGERLDARTDLFSFGLVLYEMATGHVAFAGETVAEVHEAIVNRAPAPMGELNPDVPPRMEEIIGKALEKDRETRYQSAGDLLADLKRLKHETDSTVAPLQQRWPLWVAGSLAMILAGVAVAWFAWHRVGTRLELAERQLTANPLEDWVVSAAISPDGKYVAYVDQTGLLLRSIDSGETHPTAVPADLCSRIWGVRWFPDGGKLVAEVAGSDGMELWVISVLGEAAPYLLYRHGSGPATISPDGRLIAFRRSDYADTSVNRELLVGSVNGEAPHKLLTSGEDQDMASPAWSPDGRWIAYLRNWTAQGSVSSSIEVRPASGGPAKTLVSESSLPKSTLFSPLQWERYLAWLPD